MSLWEKKDVAPELVRALHKKYGCDLLTASILARRGVMGGKDLLYYLEDDPRYLHNPFLFHSMEDVVDRIYNAKDEEEKVLIFGDRDVDGVTSTVMLYEYLKELGIEVTWRIPTGNDSYGLTTAVVDEFVAQYGSLIITVDCGISNVAEIAHAAEIGVDVIIVDHHNEQGEVPIHALIINPKMESSGYPFRHLSGCGVTYKLVSALRFARSEAYKQEICLLNVRPANDSYMIEGIKTVNMTETDRICETITPGLVSISQTRLLPFLQGQQIFVWDEPLQRKTLTKIFGEGLEFQLFDIRSEIEKLIPPVRGVSLIRLAALSTIGKYQSEAASELDAFFNIFVTFMQKKTAAFCEQDSKDVQLVMLATLADLMPLQNENRLLVRQGLRQLNEGKARSGLLELMSRQKMLGKTVSTMDLSWEIIPSLNAAGRLGQPEKAIELFLAADVQQRNALADVVLHLNSERRQIGSDIWPHIESLAYKSLEEHEQKLIFIADEKIHRGVTGILANKLAQLFKVPALVITFLENNTAVGSMRSARGYDVSGFLDSFTDLFINHGGHNYAAGFSMTAHNLDHLRTRVRERASSIEFGQEAEERLIIDAELPHSFLNPDILKLTDRFEPYGEANPQLLFLAKRLKIVGADVIGKTERMHLKLTLSAGAHKWPAMFWNASERLKRDFDRGDNIDAVFTISRNTFNGAETAQMILKDAKKCE